MLLTQLIMGSVCALSLLDNIAFAQNIFTCKDASGRTITSNIPSECAEREKRVLNRDGSVKEIVSPPLSAEELRLKKEEQAREKAEIERKAEELRRDRMLLSIYPSERDLDEAFVRVLNVPVTALRAFPRRIKLLTDEIKKIHEESEFYIGKPWPPALKRRLDNVVFGIEQERRSIEEKEEEIRRIIARFEADRQRYRALSEAAKNRPRH
jgi:hypothetical protein